MSNEISQAEPAEVITPEAEVQETATDEVSAQTEPQTEKPLTADDYRRIAHEEATKVAQSQVAKGENRINQRIQEKFSALEESKGVLKLSEEQVQQARRDIVTDAYVEPDAQTPAGAPPANGNPIQVLNSYLGAVFEEVGVAVTANDPEFKKLQDAIDEAWTIDGPQGLVKVQRAAIKAAESKLARLEAQRKNAAARVAGGGEGSTSDNNISNITDAKELYMLGEKKIGGRK